MNLCRLCGEEKSPLDFSVELNDITSANCYRDLIELHTRVSLKANKLLPQSICEECRALIDGFVEFSDKILKVQEGFDEEQLDPVLEVKECFVQIEPLEESGITRRVKFDQSESPVEELLEERVVSRSSKRQRRPNMKYYNEDEDDDFEEEESSSDAGQSSKSKRGKFEAITIKVESEEYSDQELSTSVNLKTEMKDESSSNNDVPNSKLKNKKTPTSVKRKKGKSKKRKSKSSVSPKMTIESREQSFYGPEIDTLEKLFEDEIVGTSKFPCLHLNVPENSKLASGEVPEVIAQQISTLRWKDILSCVMCNVNFEGILELRKHRKDVHLKGSKIFGCQYCKEGDVKAKIQSGTVSETRLINHITERHYFDHLMFCCMVCSKMFFDLNSLQNHYKTHDYSLYTCFICGFAAKDLEVLKCHKAQHMIKETGEKSDNLMLCEKIQDKFDRGILENPTNPLVNENERNLDGTVTDECQQRLTVDWSFGTFHCPLCNLTYTKPFDLFVHSNLDHMGKPTKKFYACKICEVQKVSSVKHHFDQLLTYFNHAIDERHHESLQFSCILCSKVFWNLLALVNHYRQVHPAFSCVPCNHCGKVFQSTTFASRHLNMKVAEDHEKIIREPKSNTWVCEVCGYKCNRSSDLEKHRKAVHKLMEPEDMVACSVCLRV
jgi:Zinc-finger associated domain (zf-AD)